MLFPSFSKFCPPRPVTGPVGGQGDPRVVKPGGDLHDLIFIPPVFRNGLNERHLYGSECPAILPM